jgi:hypothetical protein
MTTLPICRAFGIVVLFAAVRVIRDCRDDYSGLRSEIALSNRFAHHDPERKRVFD